MLVSSLCICADTIGGPTELKLNTDIDLNINFNQIK